MAFVNATYLSSEHVVLHCECCQAQVDTIHSKEILPLLGYLADTEQQVLCFDCDGESADLVPDILVNTGNWFLVVKDDLFADFPWGYVHVPEGVPACLVIQNSTDNGK